jgi:hypothetical protein
MTMDGSPSGVVPKPMKGDPVVILGVEFNEVKPRRDERHERIGRWNSGNTDPPPRTRRVCKSSGSQLLEIFGWKGWETAKRARGVARRRSLPQRESLCRLKLKGVTGMK